MSRVSSSIFSSEPLPLPHVPPPPGRRRAVVDLVVVTAWTALFLALFDLAVDWGLKQPWVPVRVRSFFGYGLSIRAKMQGLIGPTEETTQPYARAGWLDPPPDPAD